MRTRTATHCKQNQLRAGLGACYRGGWGVIGRAIARAIGGNAAAVENQLTQESQSAGEIAIGYETTAFRSAFCLSQLPSHCGSVRSNYILIRGCATRAHACRLLH